MAVPVLKLNLVPPPSLWRQQHHLLGWLALGVGAFGFLLAGGVTYQRYYKARQAGQEIITKTAAAQKVASQQRRLQGELQDVDVNKELPRWKLAERILQERSLRWSRLTADLEQCLVQGVRVKSLQKTVGSDKQVLLKLKGEAQTRAAEGAFVLTLRKDPTFAQVVLEREAERQGGGWEFEMSLPAVPVPPPFAPVVQVDPMDLERQEKKAASGASDAAPRKPAPAPAAKVPTQPAPRVPAQPPQAMRPQPTPIQQRPQGMPPGQNPGRNMVPRPPGMEGPQRPPRPPQGFVPPDRRSGRAGSGNEPGGKP